MLTFKYEARDSATGRKIKAQVQADSERTAARLIQDQGLAPLSIEIIQEGGKTVFDKVKTKDRVLFARQLSTLINAGLPLAQSLRTVQQQASSKVMKMVVSEVISDVEGGRSLADSLKKHPQVFNNVFTNMVAAGEASGTLDSALERLANQQEKDAEIMSKIRGAMVYPIVVVFVMMAVLVFMLVGVLPQVKTLYDGLGSGEMPFITKILLGLSGFTVRFWWVFVILLIIAVFFSTRLAKTLGGRRFIDKFKMHAWLISRLYMKMYMARFARTGATLVASGLPLIQMLEVTGDAIGNMYIKESVDKAIGQVKGGKSLAEAINGDPNFLELVPNMLRIGEQSGSIEQMLAKTADYYEKEVDNEVKNISTIIEPVLMIVLGVVAMLIVAAVLLPIYGLAGKAFIK